MDRNSPQYKLCSEVLHRLYKEDVLNHVIIIGSWCLLVYEDYFQNVVYHAGIRTRDIDFLIPLPPTFDHKVDVEVLLKDLDFVRSMQGQGGYMQFVHSDLMLEFIVPERGRGSEKPIEIPALGINAQPLRFMDFLSDNAIRLTFTGVQVLVPHPANFALIKTIISTRRPNPVKQENDLRQAIDVFRALLASGEEEILKERFHACPAKWRKSILSTLADQPLTEAIIDVLSL